MNRASRVSSTTRRAAPLRRPRLQVADAADGAVGLCADRAHRLRTRARLRHSRCSKFGWRFLVSSDWDPVNEEFGALPFIFGTLVSSLIALIIAVPLSIATAVYLTELAPLWLRQPLTMFIELLAAVPSVILGLWGIFVMVPWLRGHLFPLLQKHLGFLPLFQGPIYGVSMLAGGIIIAIMILPIITSVSREILRSVPGLQREAAYALGATRWEVTRIAVLSYAKKGLFGAVILGLGRALGETMAVTMVIGNTPADRQVAFRARLHAGQRRRQRIHRSHDRHLSERAV